MRQERPRFKAGPSVRFPSTLYLLHGGYRLKSVLLLPEKARQRLCRENAWVTWVRLVLGG